VKVAKATGWPAGLTPAAARGLKVNAFAKGLDHPRWLYVLPNGDVLVAESSGPGTDALGPHVAALGLTFSAGQRLGSRFAQGAFVGEHGSWNRNPPSGYKVVFVPFGGAQPAGLPIDILTGFISGGKAFGRPVGVQIARDGSLLVADDVGNTVWRVSSA
jgi:glucose/arabinose dehydrogenase